MSRIAIIGTGISGLVCAHLLHADHNVHLYEANDYIGGHTHTVTVEHEGKLLPVDTGFIVCNDRNYPGFLKIMASIGIEPVPTSMSFSVHCNQTGFEYGGASVNALLGQRRNIVNPKFHQMVRDIFRFNREAPRVLDDGTDDADPNQMTLGEYLDANHYSDAFVNRFLIPMGAAIWSAPLGGLRQFPVRFFVRFFHNHGMLQVKGRPQWMTIQGGSQRYVEAITAPFRDSIRLQTPVRSVQRTSDAAVEVRTASGEAERYDEVIMASHSDQALAMLTADSGGATSAEREILGALPYQENDTVLHWDRRLLPQRERCWSSWNYHLLEHEPEEVVVTYNLSMLQHLPTSEPLCVTLNHTDQIDPEKILMRFRYAHPTYTPEGIAAQRRWGEISGRDRIHYCGAYWGYGFHEDGVRSALRVCEHFGKSL
ncbi:MAG: NAD(P)/FAD-dependent oxidoreductase [Planctomycetota bacterium]